MECLKHTKKEATALAEKEFYNFFDAEAVDEQDPLGSLTEVISLELLILDLFQSLKLDKNILD